MKNSGHSSVTLEDVCAHITDGKHGDCQDEANSGFYFLSCKDVSEGKLNYESARQITEADFVDTHRRTKLEPSDILVTNSGTIGRMAIAPDNELTRRTTFQKSVAILKPIPSRVEAKFLYYRLQSDMRRLTEYAGGTAQKNLLLRDLRAFLIELPSLPIQRRIAATLSAYDELIENNTRRIQSLERMAQALYREWFVNFRFPGHAKVKLVASPLGKIPQGWTPGKLGDIADEVRRGVNPDDIEPDTPYIGLEHIPRKSIALSDWGTAKEVQSAKLVFKKGEILFGKIRPYFHKVGVAVVDGVCSTDAIVIVPKKPEHFALVLVCVSSEPFVSHATQTSQGTKMPRANWDVLTKYSLPVPPAPLLSIFSESVNDAVSLIQNLVFKNRNLHRTRDLLLPKLISGALDLSKLEIETGSVTP